MIIKHVSDGWEIIYQRSHGVLAAQIAFYWKKKERPIRWVETIIAISDHDDAQLDFAGKDHITASGAPMSFKMKEINLEQPAKNSKYSLQKSRWIGLLTSLHSSFLYNDIKDKSNDITVFLEKQALIQKELVKDLKISLKEAHQSYRLLEWCDALSLILCQNLLLPEERKMEISKASDGVTHQLWQRKKDNTLAVYPWCFEEDEFEVAVESRLVKQLVFKDDKELEVHLSKSKVIENTWKFKK